MKSVVKIVLLCVMGVYAVLGLSAVITSVAAAPMTLTSQTITTAETDSNRDDGESGYIVKSVGGKIAVEDISSGKIIRTTDTMVSMLPEKDRIQLKRGITVKNKSELRSVLEDFCS